MATTQYDPGLDPRPFSELSPEEQAIRNGVPNPVNNNATGGLTTNPTGLLSLPPINTYSIEDIMGAIGSPTSAEDTRKLMTNLQEQETRVAELLKPTAREQELMGQISGIQGGAEGGATQLAGRAG